MSPPAASARRRSRSGIEIFEIEFDFIAHRLDVRTSRGAERFLPLEAQSVADFYHATLDLLNGVGVSVAIKETPNEVPNPIRFSRGPDARRL